MQLPLTEHVALITGGGRGIGRATALRLSSMGASVVVNDLEQEVAETVVQEIKTAGGRASAYAGSVTDASFGEAVVRHSLATFGGLDIFVSNAGYTQDGVIQKMTDNAFQSMLDVHLVAPFRILRAAAHHFKEAHVDEKANGVTRSRKVVLISSIAGLNGGAGQVNYGSAKAGLIGMTKSLAKEWGRYNVCVNCVAFGLIETRLTADRDDPVAQFEVDGNEVRAGMPREMRTAISAQIPLGRPGTVEEAAGAVSLLCSPDSNYISGQILLAGGGLDV